MQSMIVTVLVLACLAAVVRGIWRQFSAKEGAGCGGCGSAKGCQQSQSSPCTTGTAAQAVEARVHWQRRP